MEASSACLKSSSSSSWTGRRFVASSRESLSASSSSSSPGAAYGWTNGGRTGAGPITTRIPVESVQEGLQTWPGKCALEHLGGAGGGATKPLTAAQA